MSRSTPSPIDVHRFDFVLAPLSRRRYMVAMALLMMISGIYLSVAKGDWLWFSRFGSVVTISGLLLLCSPMFAHGVYKAHGQAYGYAEVMADNTVSTTTEASRKVGDRALCGVVVSILGTLIWGFGDLVPKLWG